MWGIGSQRPVRRARRVHVTRAVWLRRGDRQFLQPDQPQPAPHPAPGAPLAGGLDRAGDAAFAPAPNGAVTALALRARGDNWMPVIAHMVSYYAVLAPCAWYFALYTHRGVLGILDAILIASLVSATLLVGRFYYLSPRDKK